MYSKEYIYNIALGALLLSRRVRNVETDTSNEVKTLNTNWDIALKTTLQDLDLDNTSSQALLELLEEEPNDLWLYAYKYPQKCAHFRRIQSAVRKDNRKTHIDKRIGIHEYQGKKYKVIFTDQPDAVGEYIMSNIPLSALSSSAALCVGLKLALLSSPLATGKGARSLIEQIEKKYVIAKGEAQEQDRLENFIFTDPEEESEFVDERTS